MKMKNSCWIPILMTILWTIGGISAEKDAATCSFYYWRVDWHSASEACRREGKRLLCYKSRKDIDDITEAFRLSTYDDAALDLWMAARNCSTPSETDCLSLHIKKSGSRVWHFFQQDCSVNFPFVCCVEDIDHASSAFPISLTAAIESSPAGISPALLLSSTTSEPETCRPVRRREIWWPETRIGETAVHKCPGKATGNVYWHCKNVHGHGRWSDRGPNFKECRSNYIDDLKDKFNTSSIAEIMSLLEDTFLPPGTEVFGGDLADVVTLMTSLPEKVFSHTLALSPAERWNMTSDYVAKSTAIFDRMVEMDNSWEDMEDQRRNSIGTHFLSTVDEMGLLLADAMTHEVEEQSITRNNLALQVTKVKPGQSLELPRGGVATHLSHQGTILLEEGYDADFSHFKGNVTVVFTLFTDLRSILSHEKNQSSNSYQLNSVVVSATVSQNRTPTEISGKVKIFVKHLTSQPNHTACVFWNMQHYSWDTFGCQLESSNSSHSLCICDHLTNFAVLMDYKGVLDQVDQTVFNYITLIGCSLSVICLAFCVIIFSCYSYHSKHSWGLRYVIHRNLCLALLIANLFLIFGLDQTDNTSVCAVVAGGLHYFFLSAFSWMLLEGVHIYMLLVVVFASRRSHWEKYYLFGYGFPMIIVAITAIARPSQYGTEDACWLSIEKGTIWAFMGPVAVILILNTAALLLAQWKASKVSGKDDNSAMFKRWLRVTFILFPVLGITWIFGFMYVGHHFEVVGYLFAVLNSLQGLCIFICHCVMDTKARNMVISSIKKKTASVNTGSTSAQQKNKQNRNSVQNSPQVEVKDTSFAAVCRRFWHRWHFRLPVSEEPKEMPMQAKTT